MKNLMLITLLSLFFTSCVVVNQDNRIPQNLLPGIWKLNGYASTNYKVEITPDGYLYWFNYSDDFNRVEEFELQYDINNNSISLFRPNSNRLIHQFFIYRLPNGRLGFDFLIQGYDANGRPITNTDTYLQI